MDFPAHQVSLPSTISQSLLKFTSIESVMLSNHLILCHPLLFLPSVFPSIRVFSSELALCIRWPQYYRASASGRPVNIQGLFPLEIPRGWLMGPWRSLHKMPSGCGRHISKRTVCSPRECVCAEV